MLRPTNTRRHPSSPPLSAQAATILVDDTDSRDIADDAAISEPARDPAALGEFFDKVTRLASLPSIADRIIRLPLQDNGDESALVEILQADPAMAASVLRRVNSSYFGMARKVDDLTRAATLLGARELKNVALTVIVKRLFDGTAAYGTYNREALWRHCLAVAVSARKIARVTGTVPQHEAYLAGLLHHVGTLLIDLHLRTRFCSMLEQLDISRATYRQERESLSFDQARLGAHVARAWNFPENIVEAIRYHECPAEYAGEHEKLVYIVTVADYLCSRAGLTALGVFNTAPPSGRAYAALGVDRVALVIIWDDLLTHLASATSF